MCVCLRVIEVCGGRREMDAGGVLGEREYVDGWYWICVHGYGY